MELLGKTAGNCEQKVGIEVWRKLPASSWFANLANSSPSDRSLRPSFRHRRTSCKGDKIFVNRRCLVVSSTSSVVRNDLATSPTLSLSKWPWISIFSNFSASSSSVLATQNQGVFCCSSKLSSSSSRCRRSPTSSASSSMQNLMVTIQVERISGWSPSRMHFVHLAEALQVSIIEETWI